MKQVKILHLYSEAMDLYGDYKNLAVLSTRIEECGCGVTVDTAELEDPIDTAGYDMVYIGHGKARNLAAIAPHFVKYGEQIKAQIEAGQLFFVTGNARELFGKSFTTVDGKTLPGIGLFDYMAVETNKVFVSDMIGHPLYDESETVYGFANRTAYLVGENRHPLLKVITGFGDGESLDGVEGTLYHNFFATWSMGPALVRNPSLMKEILKRLLGEDYRECDFSLEQKALDLVVNEFKK